MSFDFSQFGCNVFHDAAMREHLPENIYQQLKEHLQAGISIKPEMAEIIAEAMKNWAIQKGATHFTHWFQPMTNITAGKHDSFISKAKDGEVLLEFSGKNLIAGEPDASSFPSGGLRNTFEARGYTMWDCTSPAFVRDKTLYIPTAFCSYTGDALDTKTPLLRSMEVISTQALRLLKIFGNTTSSRVIPTVGAEQEYFLIDRTLYEQRLDLKICGRTLLGAKSCKGQEMDDHYFGRIRLRVAKFMQDLDKELWQLGITAKTKHNEVAPAQHELAPIYDSVNIACDQNQITMEAMRRIAKQNNLACLLHEKPFAYVNGSGKHNNWSLCTDDGINLLDPGKNPYENMQFLVLLCAIITAVDKHADLLRLSAAVAGNDHRLGAHEAPPAIIAIFLGDQLTELLYKIAEGVTPDHSKASIIEMGVSVLPKLRQDDSDRNRTSPFAFTGNKFEFRMVGSSASISFANYVLNTIVADVLMDFASRLERSTDFDRTVQHIIHDTMRKHGRVVFNDNNYTQEWIEQAQQRGLPHFSDTVESIKAFIAPHNIDVLQKHHILSPVECQSRYEIMLENYIKVVTIEANTLLEILQRQIIPTSISYVRDLASSYLTLQQAGIEHQQIKRMLDDVSTLVSEVMSHTDDLQHALSSQPNQLAWDTAVYVRDHIRSIMEQVRQSTDRLEALTDKQHWPLPSYSDLLHRI